MKKEKILALDVGKIRVGVAINDDLNLTSQALCVLARRPHKKFLEKIKALALEYQVDLILLGLPLRTDDSIGPEAQSVLALEFEIKKLGFKTQTHDERYSSCEAHEILSKTGATWDKRQKAVDKIAAALILESYLKSGT